MPIETKPWDPSAYLVDAESQAAYLDAALEDGDPRVIATALGNIAKARGVAGFAREAGMSREAVYKSFQPEGNPTLETFTKALKALGFRLRLAKA